MVQLTLNKRYGKWLNGICDILFGVRTTWYLAILLLVEPAFSIIWKSKKLSARYLRRLGGTTEV